jgi:hypothetical protein
MKISSKAELKPVFRAMYEQAEALLACEKQVLIEVSEFKPKRSNEQNAYYWLYNAELANFFNDVGLSYGEFEIPYTSEIIHDIQKKLFGVKTTTKMKTGEFCEYIHRLQSFWSEKTNGEFMMSELPESYLIRKGFDLEYNLR